MTQPSPQPRENDDLKQRNKVGGEQVDRLRSELAAAQQTIGETQSRESMQINQSAQLLTVASSELREVRGTMQSFKIKKVRCCFGCSLAA